MVHQFSPPLEIINIRTYLFMRWNWCCFQINTWLPQPPKFREVHFLDLNASNWQQRSKGDPRLTRKLNLIWYPSTRGASSGDICRELKRKWNWGYEPLFGDLSPSQYNDDLSINENSHHKGNNLQTVLSFNWNLYTGKTSLYWDGPLYILHSWRFVHGNSLCITGPLWGESIGHQ